MPTGPSRDLKKGTLVHVFSIEEGGKMGVSKQAKNEFGELVYLPDLPGHSRQAYALEWNGSGSILASGSGDKSLRLWNVETNKSTGELRGHTDIIHQLRWDPMNEFRVASTSADRSLRVWDAKAGKIANSISTTGGYMCLAYSLDGKYIALTTTEGINLIDTRKYRILKKIANPSKISEMRFDSKGHLYVAAGHPQGHGIFEVSKLVSDTKGSTLHSLKTIPAHTSTCHCLNLDPTSRYLALGSDDSLVSIWDLDELHCLRALGRSSSAITSVAFSADGQFIASGAEKGSEGSFIDIADVESGKEAFQVSLKRSCQGLCWHPKTNILAYVGDISEKFPDRDGIIRMVQIKANGSH